MSLDVYGTDTVHFDDPPLPPDGPQLDDAEDVFYREVRFPDEQFMLRDQNEDMDGPFSEDDFVRDPERGFYYCNTSHSVFLRCTFQQDNLLHVLDGDGRTWEYTMVPVPSTPSPESGPETE